MFEFPLPSPPPGLYDKLRVGPEATAEEIGEAKQELVNTLRYQKNLVDRQLDEAYRNVDGLREAVARLRELTEAGSEIDTSELRTAQQQVTKLEDAAIQYCPEFLSLRDQSSELESKISEANRISLQNSESRREHDRNNPPFELLKLDEPFSDHFGDNRVAISLLERELTEFFEQAGEIVYHPSDLTRNDFSGDCNPNSILDGNSE